MTEEQKAKYEKIARNLFPDELGEGRMLQRACFKIGTEHAHPIGFNLGKEEGKVEGRQDFKRDLILGIANHTALSAQDIVRIQEVINLIK